MKRNWELTSHILGGLTSYCLVGQRSSSNGVRNLKEVVLQQKIPKETPYATKKFLIHIGMQISSSNLSSISSRHLYS
ncbi:uncharacterized protein UV8b_07924 [Ustilaginoidea virens]|uniref:Uncharacterized protein n=1 Tax=Ustilaginoidea virens TaxID=1159556 RepID=A0A8E5HY67_USTVR|nr:uncharacterized protein UV8b_07924 [Ustilaginoidea virens]QUC23683.1 hypothetical protein UV8b_07924 [Ustilaginoidea virens]